VDARRAAGHDEISTGIHNSLMSAYIIRRLLFMVPTLFGIMLVAFVVVQFAPGGRSSR